MKGVIPIKNNHHPLDKIEKWLVFTGYAAFVWSTLFTLIHVYWAAGGTLGFEGKTMGKALFIINLVAIALCIIAAFTALALVQAWGRRFPSWLLLTSAWGACVVLGLRGCVGIIQSLLDSESLSLLLVIIEPFFLLGGILYGLLAFLYTSNNKKRIK
ncbi:MULTISPECIES: DUF3995 domain-containing protein [Bacillus]|uniref:DUF3995 domain-containing protein n=1 Tax=Bacillus TaxID=1386 RepID=UPI00077A4887|nr:MULTISPECIES: DUF3995 domain-containing protein [Bacillus cereus group]KXY79827.1 hypothetical protein AT270_07415 [Bacillus cereus]MED2994980.1 DUF3995 domain-containing protein [Bacillus tropicus]OTY53035.1 hypothetical protein BK748_19425 [Bacillus thuringiensis serovar graciosensis]